MYEDRNEDSCGFAGGTEAKPPLKERIGKNLRDRRKEKGLRLHHVVAGN